MALLHNLAQVKHSAPGKKIIAMVKANAYGCGLSSVLPVLDGQVDAFGVACLEEALALRALGGRGDCVLFQGVYSADELALAVHHNLQCVVHQPEQLAWILATPLPKKIKVWIKVNTGMYRLGFSPKAVVDVTSALLNCPWIEKEIGLMTHLASADEPDNQMNKEQLKRFTGISLPNIQFVRSISNSAAILALPETHADVVRPGIMLYGVSPFADQTGTEIGLMPVMSLRSAVIAIHHCKAHTPIGYGGTWQSDRPRMIGVVAIGYGDGYPRHIAQNTPTWINGNIAPIVGRVSMDMLMIDLTDCLEVKIGDPVELWGPHIPVETIAKFAQTNAYELLCQISSRVRGV